MLFVSVVVNERKEDEEKQENCYQFSYSCHSAHSLCMCNNQKSVSNNTLHFHENSPEKKFLHTEEIPLETAILTVMRELFSLFYGPEKRLEGRFIKTERLYLS